MNIDIITPATALIFKFYTQCFAFPYEEMNYELQNLFRVLENEDLVEEELILADQALTIINLYQGEEISGLRSEYVTLFTSSESENIICPIVASDFCKLATKRYDSFEAEEYIYESSVPINTDEPVDSIVNYLQYLSYACDEYFIGILDPKTLNSFFENHIVCWIPLFCDHLYRVSNLSFYKEVAIGLKESLLFLGSDL
jgi:TorA maturation chaperone TorD